MHREIKFVLRQQYRSIKELADCSLPAFSVITGANGSGKTHLFEAIEQGKVVVEGIPPPEIRRFDWLSFAPQIDEAANPANLRQQREQAIRQMLNTLGSFKAGLIQFFTGNQVTGDPILLDADAVAQISEDKLATILQECRRAGKPMHETEALQFAKLLVEQRSNLDNQILQHARQFGDLPQILSNRSVEFGRPIISLTDNQIRADMPLTWAPNNALQFQIAAWFAAWHSAWEYNKINEFYATQRGETHRSFLGEEAFRQRYGPEPWELTNRVLTRAGVRYQFNRPATSLENLEQNFELRLVDHTAGVEIQVRDLSSGEKILLATTLLFYQTTGEMGLATLPKMLLLDEIDAPLHPSFTRVLLSILNDELVTKCGLAVMLATHSPSTVALAPQGSVFELIRHPRQFRPINPSEATQILASGFVSITPSDIVVVTESTDDPIYYQAAYNALVRKERLTSSPALKFIGASNQRTGEGGGAGQVRNWASKLHDLGLDRFRGLIDRDAGSKEDLVVRVLERYSIENYIYDPLTLVAFLIHRGVLFLFPKLKLERVDAVELLKVGQGQMQEVIDQFCRWVSIEANEENAAKSSKVRCNYVGFPAMDLPKWWIEKRGHDLETLLKRTINPLAQQEKRSPLIKDDRSEIIMFQTQVLPELVSIDLSNIFEKLRNG